MTSLTSANSVILLTIPGLIAVPTQLQGYAADDIFDVDAIENAELVMGLDGKLSGGFVPVPVKMNITLQADSPSAIVFDNWFLAQQQARELYWADGHTSLPAVGRKYAMRRGALSGYKPLADAKRTLQPRRFTITWEAISPGDI